jgi:hypothetical protein
MIEFLGKSVGVVFIGLIIVIGLLMLIFSIRPHSLP